MSVQAAEALAIDGAPTQGSDVPKLSWPKKSYTFRMRQDIRARLDLLVEVKRRRNALHGLVAKGIDATAEIEAALEAHLDAELAGLGFTEEDFSKSDLPKQREEDAKRAVDRIEHLLRTEAKK